MNPDQRARLAHAEIAVNAANIAPTTAETVAHLARACALLLAIVKEQAS